MKLNAGNKGLANLGNTCYMNSALQCLSHLITFHPNNENFFHSCKRANEHSLIYEWFKFQRQMWNNDNNNMINPIQLLRKFQKYSHENKYYFNNFAQNDIDEFLTIFLDLLHQGIKREVIMKFDKNINDEADKINVKSNETWKRFYENDYSYIVENFSSQLLSITSCTHCDYYASNHDPIRGISLEIKPNTKSIYDCLNEYTKKFQIDNKNKWKCDQCKNYVCPFKQTKLWNTSDILILLIKRYKGDQKINTFIEYPFDLNMEDYNINFSSDKNNNYSLQSFAIHEGSLNGGHYYAICKNYLNNKWYQYNDTNVSELSNQKIICS